MKKYWIWIIVVVLLVVVIAVLVSMNGGTTTAPAGGGAAAVTAPKAPGAPIVVTTATASASSTMAVVKGIVSADGSPTTYWFQYGTVPSFGMQTSPMTLSASSVSTNVMGQIVNLKPSKTYYFRLAAQNAYGTVYGANYNFITSAK